MHKAIIGIGSNMRGAQRRLIEAVERLTRAGVVVRRSSDIYTVNKPYYNQVLDVDTFLDYDDLRSLGKDVESDMGRTPRHKALGRVPVDIDVVIFDKSIMRQADYNAEYFSVGYQQIVDNA